MKFHGVSKSYKRIHDHCNHARKYGEAAYSICNLKYDTKRDCGGFPEWAKL